MHENQRDDLFEPLSTGKKGLKNPAPPNANSLHGNPSNPDILPIRAGSNRSPINLEK
jgi:hypothetical protein